MTSWLTDQADAIAAALEAVDAAAIETNIERHLNGDNASVTGIFRLERAGDDRLWELAIHESGHAVVAAALGLRVRSVLIRANGTGRCQNEGHQGTFAGRLNCILAQLAGYLAQHYDDDNALRAHRLSVQFDVVAARRELDSINADFPELPLSYLATARLAAAIVYAQWPAIFRTAVALRKNHSLTGDEVHNLFSEG